MMGTYTEREMDSYILTKQSDLEDLVRWVGSNKNVLEHIVLDIETNGVQEKTADTYGIGICFSENQAFYIPIRNQDGSKTWDPTVESSFINVLYDWCNTFKLVGHNIIFDVLVLQREFPMDKPWWELIYSDTILLKHAIDEEKPFGLKENAVKYLGDWADKAQQEMKESVLANGGSVSKENFQMYLADTEILGKYCCWDVMLTYQLFEIFEAKLRAEGLEDLFYNVETMPLYREVTIPMKWGGIPVDVEYFRNLEKEINADMAALKSEFLDEIYPDIRSYILEKYNKEVPPSKKGDFPKELFFHAGLEIPVNNKGKETMARGAIEKLAERSDLTPLQRGVIGWLLNDTYVDPRLLSEAQKTLWHKRNPDTDIFNVNSKNDLRYLFFDVWKLNPVEKTETGLDKVDADFLEEIKDDFPIVNMLIDYNKLNKLAGTYIVGILDRQLEGTIYTSMLQFGTTSGRYASRNPNLQNLPRPKEEDAGLSPLVLKYTNAIRAGFVAGAGHKFIDADYSALEPRCFATVSGEKKLQDVFKKGEDLYSRIAIDVFKLDGVSADPNSENYLKKIMPEYRQKVKVFSLAVVYGAEAGRIAQAMKVDYEEAQEIINMYLDAYPGLKKYMTNCDRDILTKGQVKTMFGRVRHLPLAKELYDQYGANITDKAWSKKKGLGETYWKIKNMRNLAKNHPIQGLAGHIVNRASIAIMREFKKNAIDGYVALQVHDQLIARVKEEHAEKAAKIVQECMENTTVLEVPMVAEPEIADNMRDSH